MIFELTYFYVYGLVIIYLLFSVLITILLIGISILLNFYPLFPGNEIGTTYECGFIPFDKVRNQFEVKFFVVGLLFVLFDLEVIFIFPWSITLSLCSFFQFGLMIIILILIGLGFMYELLSNVLTF